LGLAEPFAAAKLLSAAQRACQMLSAAGLYWARASVSPALSGVLRGAVIGPVFKNAPLL